jgi:hypothetical protein
MSNDDVPGRQRGSQLSHNIQKRVVVRDEDLNVVAHLGQFGRRAHEIRDRAWVSIPDKHVKALATQIVRDPASDNAETDYTDVFSGSTRHWG